MTTSILQTAIPPTELRQAALHWLSECDPQLKTNGVIELAKNIAQITVDSHRELTPQHPLPGRPSHPLLVMPRLLKRRSMVTAEGRAILIHAMAHIEFNAINLALDAVWRFPNMPQEYYADWLSVAGEEAQHFILLSDHLVDLGYQYGDFPAHNSLWEMAFKTQSDVLARIALVPRIMEARGLDASPQVRAKLAQAGDLSGAQIMDRILTDEIGHVAIGNRWYAYLCAERNLNPISTFDELSLKYAAPALRGPFNMAARRAAGFSEAELKLLENG
jgi:uncharacterized ferritin-like protein (DUF455 family)